MEIEPYSIYVNHRPFQIAFLVEPTQDNGWFEVIMNYNRDHWGGKFNPIVFTDGKTMGDEWWNFLKNYDPDIIYSTVDLSDELKRKIHIFLTPIEVEEFNKKQDHKYVYLNNHAISILPTAKNVSLVSDNFGDDRSKIVVFEVDETTPKIIQSFLDCNFGLLEPGQMMSYQMKKALESCEVQNYKITDSNSLNEALLDMGNFHKRVIFPAQICALPNNYKESEYDYHHEKFEVIVGDSLNEKTYFWNRTFLMGAWLRTKYTQMWLPTEIANDSLIRTGLEKFLNRFVGSTGNQNYHGAVFSSFSMSEKELSDLAISFRGKIWHPVTHTLLTKHEFPKYQHSPFFYNRKSSDFHRAHSQTEHITFDEPDVEYGSMGGERWFIDINIQFRPERFKNIIGGEGYWWQLPKRNSVVRDLKIFNKPARINEKGSFSVMMARRTTINPDDNTLVVSLPDDNDVFSALICSESFDCIEKDHGARYQSQPFYYINRSDKGMYLSGVIGLFSGLSGAHGFFQERYWRNVFERMANHNQNKDEQSKNNLLNILKKKIDSGMDFKQTEAQEWLAKNVVNIAKNYSREEIDLSFAEFAEMAQKETDEYNANPSGSTIPFDKDGLQERVSDLVEMGILLLGLKPKCPRCGYRIWYQVDDVKQQILCRGCGYDFALPSEESWSYRLNNLVRGAVSRHGTIPLLLALGQVKHDARSSFMYMPSIELFKKSEAGKRDIADSEIDLVCIIDGKFTIGEIKQSVSLFSQKDFTKMKEVARLIRPDNVIFYSLDKEPNHFVTENIKKLQEELIDLGIRVTWYPLNYWVLNSNPVR